MSEIKEQKYSYKSYQISLLQDYEYSKIATKIQKDVKSERSESSSENEFFDLKQYIKTFNHSLFTPILIYTLELLHYSEKEKKEINMNVGFSKANNIDVVYISLNKKMYDIFFMKTKKELNGVEIDFSENENFLIPNQKYGYNNDKKEMLDIMNDYIGVDQGETFFGDLQFDELCILKKKEIISSFRMGYAVQEQIIENFEEELKPEDFEELPNLIYFSKNDEKKAPPYIEYDRIILLNKEHDFKYFKVFLSFDNGKLNLINDGKPLKLSSNTLNFIEVKRSFRSFTYKKEVKEDKTYYSNNSNNTYINKALTSICNFVELFKNIKPKYQYSINLLYIVDSNYSLSMLKDLSEFFKEEVTNNEKNLSKNKKLNIYLCQIDSDFERIIFINKEQNFESKINTMIDNYNKQIEENKKLNEEKFKEYELKYKENELKLQKTIEDYDLKLQKNKEDYDLKLQKNKEDYDLKLQKNKEDYDLKFQKNKEDYENQIKELNLKANLNDYINELFDIDDDQLKFIFGDSKTIDYFIGMNIFGNNITIKKKRKNLNLIEVNKSDTLLYIKNVVDYNFIKDKINKINIFNKVMFVIKPETSLDFLSDKIITGEFNITFFVNSYKLFLLIAEKSKEKKILFYFSQNYIPIYETNKTYIFNKELLRYFERLNIFIQNIQKQKNDSILIIDEDNQNIVANLIYIFNKDKESESENHCKLYTINNELFFYKNDFNMLKNDSKVKSTFIIIPYIRNLKAQKEKNEKLVKSITQFLYLSLEQDINDAKVEEIIPKGCHYIDENIAIVHYVITKENYLVLTNRANKTYNFIIKSIAIMPSKLKGDNFYSKIPLLEHPKTNSNSVDCVEINYVNEKLIVFLTSIFLSISKEPTILLIGDEFNYVNFYLLKAFKPSILKITTKNKQIDKTFDYCSKILGLKNSDNESGDTIKNNDNNYMNIGNEQYDIIMLTGFPEKKSELTFLKENLKAFTLLMKNETILCFNYILNNYNEYTEIIDLLKKNGFYVHCKIGYNLAAKIIATKFRYFDGNIKKKLNRDLLRNNGIDVNKIMKQVGDYLN